MSKQHEHQVVMIAAYGDLDVAREDFAELEKRLKHGMELRAGSLITKNAEGEAHVDEAANRHGRIGTFVGAGLGLLVGLVFEPVILAVLVGGAGGAVATAIAEHEVRSGLRKGVGDALENGTAVVLALAYPNGRGHVEEVLTRANSITSMPMDSASMQRIDDAVAAEIKKLPDTPDTSS